MSGYYKQAINTESFERYSRKKFLDSITEPMLSYIDDDQGSTIDSSGCPWGRGDESGYQEDLRTVLSAPLGVGHNMEALIERDEGYIQGFSKHFSNIEDELVGLYEQVDAEIKHADTSHVDNEKDYYNRLSSVANLSDAAFEKFKVTQEKLQSASQAANRITMRLESHEKARAHAEHALNLIQHIKNFKTNPSAESIFDEPTERSAKDIHDLYLMTPDLVNCHDPSSYEAECLQKVADKISQKRRKMQKALQAKLETAHAESDERGMVTSAHLLVTYFDADKTHTDYLRSCSSLCKHEGYSKNTDFIQQGAVDPQAAFDEHVRDEIFKGTVSFESEYQLIKRIFPQPALVMKKLVIELFEKRIQQFVDAMKAACSDQSILEKMGSKKTIERAQLDFLDVAYASIQSIELQLAKYDLSDLDVHSLSLKLFPELKGVAAGSDDQDYIDREMKNLASSLEGLLEIAILREQAIAENSGDLSAFKGETEAERKDTFLVLVMQSSSAVRMYEEMIDETLSAIKRSYSLSAEADRQANAGKIVDYFLDTVQNQVATALVKSKERIPKGGKQKSVTEFAKYFCLAEQVNRIVSALRGRFTRYIKRRMNDWNTLRERVVQRIESIVMEAQVDVGVGLGLCLSGMLTRVQRMLADRQPPSSDDYLHAGNGTTQTCDVICDVLSKQFQFITASLHGKVQHNFVRSFVSRLYKILIDHFTTLKFSEQATIEIKSDIKKYTSTITQNIDTSNSDIEAKIEVLNDLVTIFLVGAVYVKDVLKEGRMAAMNKEVLQKFVRCRADYSDHKAEFDAIFA